MDAPFVWYENRLDYFSLQKIHKYSSVKNDKTPEEYKADEYDIIFIGTDEDKYMFIDVV
jgi:hypothetical protein